MQKSGFTLLELSIVLVIIGLIIGGVTVGSELIKQAEMQGVARQFGEIETALATFKLKYNKLPGDMNNAFVYWGATCGTNTVIGSGNPDGCNGNGDGSWTGASSAPGRVETMRAWQHMSLAGIWPGSFTGQYVGAEDKLPIANRHLPRGKLTGTMFALRSMDSGYFQRFGPAIQFGEGSTTVSGDQNKWYFPEEDALSPGDAKSIDAKMDDGIADTGRLIGANSDCTDTSFSDATPGDDYKVAKPNKECRLYYWLN